MKRWTRFRSWIEKWRTAPKRLRGAEREIRLQQSINRALHAQIKRLEQESALLVRGMYGELPGLSPGEIERLALLAGECGRVAQAVSKVLRFGWESRSPYGGRTNRVALERDVGRLRAVVTLMLDADDLGLADVQGWQKAKRMDLAKWTLYQECSMPREEQLAMMAAIAESDRN